VVLVLEALGSTRKKNLLKVLQLRIALLKGIDNGVRIKAWLNESRKIIVTYMKFENITMNNVMNPIIIDQEYCPWNQCSKEVFSLLSIHVNLDVII